MLQKNAQPTNLHTIAHQAMLDRELEPDLPPAVSGERHDLQTPGRRLSYYADRPAAASAEAEGGHDTEGGEHANCREQGEERAAGPPAGAVPVPVRVTDCCDPVALSAIASDAPNAPAAAGLNSTETVHVAAAASVVPHVVADLMNEVALVPVMVSDARFSVAVPEFLTVTTCAAVVEPTAVDANVRAVGVSVTAGAAVTALTLTVSRPKSVHSEAQVVRLKTILLMFGPD